MQRRTSIIFAWFDSFVYFQPRVLVLATLRAATTRPRRQAASDVSSTHRRRPSSSAGELGSSRAWASRRRRSGPNLCTRLERIILTKKIETQTNNISELPNKQTNNKNNLKKRHFFDRFILKTQYLHVQCKRFIVGLQGRERKLKFLLNFKNIFVSSLHFLKCLFKSSIYSQSPILIWLLFWVFWVPEIWMNNWKQTIENKQYVFLFLKASAFWCKDQHWSANEWIEWVYNNNNNNNNNNISTSAHANCWEKLQKIICNFLQSNNWVDYFEW